MKSKGLLLIKILFLSTSFGCLSQNWTPLNPSYSYVFTKGSAFEDLVIIRTDSVSYSGDSQICSLHRIMKPWPVPMNTYTHQNVPLFLKKQCIVSPDSVCFTDPGFFIIKPFFPLDSIWTFDPENNITARITDVFEDTLLGVNDSVKCIVLSTQDTLWLSKDHGITCFQMPDDSLTYTLKGIKELNQGYQVPGFADFFSYKVNDIFEYRETSTTSGFHVQCHGSKWYQDKVISKTVGTDTITFVVDRYERDSSTCVFYNSYGYDTVYTKHQWLTLRYCKNDYSFLELDNYQLFISPIGHKQVLYYSYHPLFNANIKKFDRDLIYNFEGDSAFPTGHPHTLAEKFGEHCGLIYKYESEYNFGSSTTTTTINLLGCVIDSVTYGNLHSIGWILTIPEQYSKDPVSVFPNPAQDILHIEGLPGNKPAALSVFTAQGNKVLSENKQGNIIEIDIHTLQPGTYLLQIAGPEFVITKHFVKI